MELTIILFWTIVGLSLIALLLSGILGYVMGDDLKVHKYTPEDKKPRENT